MELGWRRSIRDRWSVRDWADNYDHSSRSRVRCNLDLSTSRCVILTVARRDKSSIKLGWKINANAKPVQTPILSMSLFLKAPLHEGSAGYPCIERDFELNLLTPEDFENGYPFINCRGSYTNFTAIIQVVR
jgi:hypothetical protein